MKSILIIGLGRFGRHLCQKFMSLHNEVMIVDRDEAAVSALADDVTSAQIADCTDENALRALGVQNFDLCFVCIGSDFASSLLITSMLKDMGATRVIAKIIDRWKKVAIARYAHIIAALIFTTCKNAMRFWA